MLKIVLNIKFILLSFVILILSSCTHGISPEVMKQQLNGFELPEKPIAGKALVYFIFRNDEPLMQSEYISIGINDPKISLSHAPSSSANVIKKNSQLFQVANIFTLGIMTGENSPIKNNIGVLTPGQYRTMQFQPGYYEFNRTLISNIPMISSREKVTHMQLEAGKTYFVSIWPSAFFNRYDGSIVHNFYIHEITSPLVGEYVLSKNFHKRK